MGFINDTSSSSSGSGERGQRGLAGRGIESITTVDNNDGSINLTFNYDDGSEPATFVNTLVSDTLIQLDKLTLEGTNMTEKFVVQSSDETRVLTVNTTTKSINLLNPLTATAPTIGNSIVNKTYADTIETLAGDAKTIGETAQATADTAIINASTAQTTANTAQTTANTAQIAANTAQYAADSAQTTADAATAVATSAYATGNTNTTNITTLSNKVNLQRVYYYIIANLYTGTLPANHDSGTVDNPFRPLNLTGIVWTTDGAGGYIYNPSSTWIVNANKFAQYKGTTGKFYRINYSYSVSSTTNADRLFASSLVKNSNTYPDATLTGISLPASFCTSGNQDSDLDRIIHMTGSAIYQVTFDDTFSLCVNSTGTNIIMKPYAISFTFEELL